MNSIISSLSNKFTINKASFLLTKVQTTNGLEIKKVFKNDFQHLLRSIKENNKIINKSQVIN